MSNSSEQYPEALAIAEHQLEMQLLPGAEVRRELTACWSRLKADPSVTDPEAKMRALCEWYAEKFKQAALEEIAAE